MNLRQILVSGTKIVSWYPFATFYISPLKSIGNIVISTGQFVCNKFPLAVTSVSGSLFIGYTLHDHQYAEQNQEIREQYNKNLTEAWKTKFQKDANDVLHKEGNITKEMAQEAYDFRNAVKTEAQSKLDPFSKSVIWIRNLITYKTITKIPEALSTTAKELYANPEDNTPFPFNLWIKGVKAAYSNWNTTAVKESIKGYPNKLSKLYNSFNATAIEESIEESIKEYTKNPSKLYDSFNTTAIKESVVSNAPYIKTALNIAAIDTNPTYDDLAREKTSKEIYFSAFKSGGSDLGLENNGMNKVIDLAARMESSLQIKDLMKGTTHHTIEVSYITNKTVTCMENEYFVNHATFDDATQTCLPTLEAPTGWYTTTA